MNTLITALVLMAAIISFLFILVYTVFGRPWEGFFGRSLVSLESSLFLVLGYTAFRRLTVTAIEIPRSLFAVAVTVYSVLVLVELMLTASLWQLLIGRRGGIRAAWRTRRARRAALAADEMADQLRVLSAALDLLADDEFALVMSTTRPR